MKTWLKGGLVGLIVGLIVLIFTFQIPFPKIIHPITWIMWECKSPGCIILLLTTPIAYAIIGAIIGLIIQKVKKK